MQPVRRYLAVYEKYGPEKLDEITLPESDLESVSEIISPTKNDPFLYNPYPINKDYADKIYLKYKIKCYLDRYDYYLEAEAI